MSTSRLPAILLAVASVLSLSGAAVACGGGGGGYGGGGGGGIVYIGGGNNRGNCNTNNYNNYNRNNNNYTNLGRAYEPFHSSYFVQPGDTFYEVSLKEYGTSAAMKYIASYNRLATTKALVPGQRLLLPSISASGRLSQSRAPAAETFSNASLPAVATTPSVTPQTIAAATVPAPAPEPERTSIPTGSTLQLDGESLGSETGVVRLRISGVALPVEVVEWTAESTKIRLPKLDVGTATKAELEVVRADGSLAASNPIELVAPVTGLAATN